MKPDWNDVPVCANWIAMDAIGDWYWYEKKPQLNSNIDGEWAANYSSRFGLVEPKYKNWKSSLTKRPGK